MAQGEPSHGAIPGRCGHEQPEGRRGTSQAGGRGRVSPPGRDPIPGGRGALSGSPSPGPGRHPEQTSDALGAAGAQLRPPGHGLGVVVGLRAGPELREVLVVAGLPRHRGQRRSHRIFLRVHGTDLVPTHDAI